VKRGFGTGAAFEDPPPLRLLAPDALDCQLLVRCTGSCIVSGGAAPGAPTTGDTGGSSVEGWFLCAAPAGGGGGVEATLRRPWTRVPLRGVDVLPVYTLRTTIHTVTVT